ncbi:MAG: hypothetical protein IPM51_04890 [Sphingobacteriaceae bacterium]|nr:hypothetical protein [Sphingobacteriaceae bacterium]
MNRLKSHAIVMMVSLGMIFLTSCGSGEKEPNPLADSLKVVNNELGGKLGEKEAALQEFVGAFNEIQENLNSIKEKEKIVNSAAKQGDVTSKQNQIKEDIQAIYDLMSKNKSRIASLSKKLKNANLKMEGMEQMIENLQRAIDQKDGEIADLKSQMEALHIELANLNTNYQNVETESEQKTEVINTAYFAIGTLKELKEKNVVTKEGGFIGIGKTTKVKEDFNKEYFTKVNIEETKTINIGSKKIKLLTNHPKSSFKIVGENPVEKIEITNPSEFWSVSKYLVIVID